MTIFANISNYTSFPFGSFDYYLTISFGVFSFWLLLHMRYAFSFLFVSSIWAEPSLASSSGLGDQMCVQTTIYFSLTWLEVGELMFPISTQSLHFQIYKYVDGGGGGGVETFKCALTRLMLTSKLLLATILNVNAMVFHIYHRMLSTTNHQPSNIKLNAIFSYGFTSKSSSAYKWVHNLLLAFYMSFVIVQCNIIIIAKRTKRMMAEGYRQIVHRE